VDTDLPWETLFACGNQGTATPSQDHVEMRVVADAALVLCAADGHGTPDARRGHLGARWAVEEAMRCVVPFARRVAQAEEDRARWPELAERAGRLRGEIRLSLRERARMHEANGPAAGVGTAGPGRCSLLGAVLTRRLLFCWQAGVGRIALIGEDGCRVLFEREAGPPDRMLLHWQPADELGTRRLVLLSTDGLCDGLAGLRAYRAFAEGLYTRLARQEGQGVRDGLDGCLRVLAERSGQDASVLAAYSAHPIE
jgi:hypothetical protein